MRKILVSVVTGIGLLLSAGYGHAGTACAIVIEADLSFMLPSVTIGNTTISANFEYAGEENQKYLWKFAGAGDEKTSLCPTTLDADLSFDLPNVLFGGGFMSTTFEYQGEQNGSLLWSLADVGQGTASYPSATYTNTLGMTFATIAADTFMMGSPADEPGRSTDESHRKVTLTEDYFIQTTEVTRAQWAAVMGTDPSGSDGCGDDCPVINISWEDVHNFITELEALVEGTYSLPTEAQWEYACRGGSSLAFANGKLDNVTNNHDNINALAWNLNNSNNELQPVAQKAPNAFGLYDMHGNVMEWCMDLYSVLDDTPATDPLVTQVTGGTDQRVAKNGSYATTIDLQRAAVRFGPKQDAGHPEIGFRLVYSPPPPVN